uniref:Uncharacterized protein n=1 Tax=Siphoviridae sp. ctub511 TaxID=2825714 RepID=A0A8S5U105_9CAUD|nr:MAG TPA: hypothetical protein [Siphoviridae sp. ctub511]
MGVIIDKKIIEFGANNCLNILGNYGRDRKAREVKYYTISTDTGIVLGRIKPDCSYEQFLEKIALNAICEAERLSDVIIIMEEEYAELCEDYTALKEEVTDEGQDD